MRKHFLEPEGESHTLCGMRVTRFDDTLLPHCESFVPRDAEKLWDEANAGGDKYCTMCRDLLLSKPDVLGRRSFDWIGSSLRKVRRDRRAGKDV